ncbi:MAG: glycosyltransferase family 39 protein [bacterium]|nr:glycosyltransferase family 39 protein [bacterium]
MKHSNFFIFVSLVLFSFVALSAVYPLTLVGGDDGRFVQDALRIGRGEVPIADYSTRAPILSWALNFVTELFGRSIYVFHIPVMISTALTAGVIFLLGKELFSRTIGIFASLLYSLVPFVLWNAHVIKTEPLTILFVSLSALFLLRAMKGNSQVLFILSGICMGLAYIERQSAIAFMLASCLLVVWDVFSNKKKAVLIVSRGSLLLFGVIVGFLPVYAYVASVNTSAANQYWLSPFVVQQTLDVKGPQDMSLFETAKRFSRDWAIAFTEQLAIEGGILFASFVLFFLGITQHVLYKKRTAELFGTGLVGLLLGGAFLLHTYRVVAGGSFRPYVFLFLGVITVAFWIGAYFYGVRTRSIQHFIERHSYIIPFTFIWIGSLIIAYSFFIPGYIREMSPPLILLSTAVLWSLFGGFSRLNAKIVGALVFIFFWSVSFFWYQDPPVGGWWWTHKTINETAEYIKNNTQPEDEVMAANVLPVILAYRHVPNDMNPYSIKFAQNENERRGTFLSPREYLSLLEARPPKYAIVDGRMRAQYFEPYPMFQDFVATNYEHVETYGEGRSKRIIEIWERRN